MICGKYQLDNLRIRTKYFTKRECEYIIEISRVIISILRVRRKIWQYHIIICGNL